MIDIDVRGTRLWVYAKDVHYGDRIGRHVITAATRREDGRIAVTFDDGKVIHEETADWMFRVLRPFCEWEQEVPGPHDGCAEFAAPGVISCDSTATIGVPWVDEWTGDVVVTLFCADHVPYFQPKPSTDGEPFPLAL